MQVGDSTDDRWVLRVGHTTLKMLDKVEVSHFTGLINGQKGDAKSINYQTKPSYFKEPPKETLARF